MRDVSTQEQLLRRNVKRFREGLVFKAHGLVHHSTLSWGVIKKKNDGGGTRGSVSARVKECVRFRVEGFELRSV